MTPRDEKSHPVQNFRPSLAVLPNGHDVAMTASRLATGSAGGARQLIDELLNAARVALGMDLTFLSHIDDGQQEFEYVSRPEAALVLPQGTRIPAAGAYCAVMLAGDVAHAVADVRQHPVLGAMPVTAEVGVGAYCGVPVHLPDGQLYGTLCGLDPEVRHDLSDDQVTVLRTISSLLGHQLAELAREERGREVQRQELLALLEPGALRMVAQPIVDVTEDRTAGFEALARFTRADGQPSRPDLVFAEAAEVGLGLIFEQAALTAALQLLPALPEDAYLSVNLSAASLTSASVVEQLAEAPLHRLILELTEHEAVEDYDRIVDALSALRGGGLRLAIDDVGAGHSSLRHILRLRPDVIKLDMSLTRDVDTDVARRAMVASLVGFAKQLNISLVGEGVETAAERDTLLGMGVCLMQGYLLGRPGSL
jgi:EAL domain-containing protein (putative c-di-GMP-specific phosphodiesterase class I)